MSEETKKPAPTFSEIMNKSAKSAIRGGTAGAVAMGANVAALMWMRTTVSWMLLSEPLILQAWWRVWMNRTAHLRP